MSSGCLCTADTAGVTQALSHLSTEDSDALSGLIAACKKPRTMGPATCSTMAWMLWEHAVDTRQAVSSAAQETLWLSQSGDMFKKLWLGWSCTYVCCQVDCLCLRLTVNAPSLHCSCNTAQDAWPSVLVIISLVMLKPQHSKLMPCTCT